METRKQNIADTIAPEVPGKYIGAILEDTPGCRAIGSASPERRPEYRAILGHQFQLTGLLFPDGRMVVANKAALAFAGVCESEISGKPFWECPWWTHSRDVQNEICDAIRKAAAGESVRFETTHLDKKGDIRIIDFLINPIFDENGNVIYLVPEGLDITETKKREVALRESEERHRILSETASDALFVMNGDVFVECNRKTLDVLYCGRKEIIGSSILDLSSQEQLDGVDFKNMMTTRIEAALQGKPQSFAWILSRFDGTLFEVELSFNRIDLSTGPRILGRLKDVSRWNRLREERQGLQERLQQAQKMEAVGTLAAGIAHDFNNILAPIVGYSELTMNQVEKDSPLYNYQDQILKAAIRAKDLIRQILTFSRKGSEVIRPVKLKVILKETLKLIRASLPSNIDIEEKIDSDGVVLSSPTHIQQVVMNLCTNAGHAMKENGGLLRVVLSEEEFTEDHAKQYSDLSPGRFLKLTVGDTGHGISPEMQQQIFDPYFTTKKKGEGTGLGLSMVHGIVKECRGEILVESEPGKGTCFTVYLPAITRSEKEKTGFSIETPGGSEEILLVDDEKPILQMYARYLERLGYSVTTRRSSVEALAAFKMNPGAYDLVITDLMMPELTGEKLAKEITGLRPDIPIILITGYSDGMSKKKTETTGVSVLLLKPVIMSDLAVTIRRLFDNGTKGKNGSN